MFGGNPNRPFSDWGFLLRRYYITFMWTLEVTTPPASEPVTVAELKAHLRLNDSSEDSLLGNYITAARQLFEAWTGRAVLATSFRQHASQLIEPLYLMRGPVRTITAVKYYDTNDVLQTASGYYSDTISIPGSVWFTSYPSTSAYKHPVAYVEFSAGWDAADVPELVKTAIRLLAAHYYENRNSHQEADLKEVPMGFRAVCDQYKTGIQGPWGN